MNDEELAQRLRRLETPVEPNPVFAESLFSALRSPAIGRQSGARRSQPVFAIAALAAVLVVAVVSATIGIRVLDGRPQRPGGGPDATPTSRRTFSPVAAPSGVPSTTAPSPTAVPTLTVPIPPDYTELKPGRYSLNRQYAAIAWPASVTLDVLSSGWQLTGAARTGGLVKYPAPVASAMDAIGQLSLWSVASLPVDVCADRDDDRQLPIGASADDFIHALRNQRGLVVSDLGPVDIDGYAGKSLRMTPAGDLNCPAEDGHSRPFLELWTAPQALSGDIWTASVPQYPSHDIHVLDVEGARYVIYTGYDTPEVGAEIRAMLNSMDIVP